MKALITYKNNSWIKEIAENLAEEFDDFHYIKAKNGNMRLIKGEGEIQEHYDSIIRIGTYANYLPSADFEYNPYEGIKLTSDKLQARKTFESKLIPTPKTFSREEIRREIDTRPEDIVFPIIGRKGSHYGGNEFYTFNDVWELKEGLSNNHDLTYFSEFYPKSREFRVHIASGKAIIVAEKIVEEENKGEFIWNLGDNGVCEDFYTYRWSEYREIEDIISTASLATKVLGLDYGAVDVIAYPTDRQEELPPVAVLEINSAPRLEEYGIQRYTQYFKWLLMHQNNRAEFKLPHELDRFSFTNNDFELDYTRLEQEGQESSIRQGEISEDGVDEQLAERIDESEEEFGERYEELRREFENSFGEQTRERMERVRRMENLASLLRNSGINLREPQNYS